MENRNVESKGMLIAFLGFPVLGVCGETWRECNSSRDEALKSYTLSRVCSLECSSSPYHNNSHLKILLSVINLINICMIMNGCAIIRTIVRWFGAKK